jgi:hypothetical protein
MLRIELAPFIEPPPCEDPDVGTEATDDNAVVPLAAGEVELDVDGTTAESASRFVHLAAELAPVLPCVYGRKETEPLLVS